MMRITAIAFVLLFSISMKFAAAADRPNIVLIYCDDLGYGDAGCYGATAIKTPNIDRIAKEGCRFTDGHCASATCTPSRYAMLTGEYAWRQKGTGIATGDANAIESHWHQH
jgi:arylsulfatase A